MRRICSAALAALAVLVWAPAAFADPPQPVDSRFQETAVVGAIDAPTTMRIAPDGSFYVAEKQGTVLHFDSADDTTGEVVVDLSNQVVDWFDRGLLGMDLDPNFATNRRMYLLYAYDAGPDANAPRGDDCAGKTSECLASARLVRVDLPLIGQAQPSDFHTLIAHEWCQQFSSHSIGTVLFGPDGALYAGAGEGASWEQTDFGQLGSPPNPCGDPPAGQGNANSSPTGEGGSLRAQDVRTSGDPTGLDGAIIRVDPTTGDPLPGNGFPTRDANAQRLAAYGFRNPFRFTFRPGTHQLWVGDVGENLTEEIDRVDNPGNGSVPNFGWPCVEGTTVAAKWKDLNLCKSPSPGGMVPLNPVAPFYTYSHDSEVVAGDGCPIGFGTVISGLAFVPPDAGWPADYEGGLFFTDFARDCIWFMPKGANGDPDPAHVRLFASGTQGGAGPIDLQIGPDGKLYYAYWSPGVGGSIHRVDITGSAPHADLRADPTEGDAPLEVHLDASHSTDPDHQALHYAWDLDGDGSFDDAGDVAELDHTFPAGDVTVRVRVSDTDELTGTASVTLHPGNTSPVPVIDTPAADGTLYSVGDAIAFAGHATDQQDGNEPGARLSWQVAIAHCPSTGCHIHPAISLGSGTSGTFAGPDHELPSHLVLTLTATDANGLSASVAREIDPRTATIRVATQPAGLPLSLRGAPAAPSPLEAHVIDGSSSVIDAPATATAGGRTWTFVRWDDGSTAQQRTVVVHGTTVRTAIYSAPDAPAPPVTPHLPPPVPPPPIADVIPPTLKLHAPHKLHAARRARVRMRCSESCRVHATAVLRGVPKHSRAVSAVVRKVGAGRTITLTFKLDRRLRAIRHSLHAGHRVTLRLVVSATDAAGNLSRRRATIRLVR